MPEHIGITVKGQRFSVMLDQQVSGWQAVCRLLDVDYLVSHARDREAALAALRYLMEHGVLDLATRVDEVTAQLGVRWAIRPREGAEAPTSEEPGGVCAPSSGGELP